MRSRILVLAITIGTLSGIAFSQTSGPNRIEPYKGSSFNTVWNRIDSERHQILPHYRIVSASTLRSVGLLAMNATLDDRNDFRQRRVKLVHPNGVCLAGVWEIDSPTPYSGYFSQGSRGLVIARASATQDFVNRDEYRAFGLAVKVFPTLDPDETVFTSNLFSVDNIKGVMNRSFIETLMTNEIPGFNFFDLRALVRLAPRLPFLVDFNNLSKQADSGPEDRNLLFRRTIEVARAGISREYSVLYRQTELPSYETLEQNRQIHEPTWVGFQAENVQEISNQQDFRNEIIDVLRKNGELRYKILIAMEKDRAGEQVWDQIGTIKFRRAIASKPCDLDLHFHHPRTDN